MIKSLKQGLYDGLGRIGIRFGVNARSLAKNSAYVTTSHAVAMLRGIVTGYIVARLFPRELYGEYQWILAVVGTLASIGIPEVYKASARAIARGNDGALRSVAFRQLLFCLVVSGVLLGMIPIVHHFHERDVTLLLVAAAVLFPLSQVSGTLFSGVTLGKSNFLLALKANVVWSVIMILTTVLILIYQPSPLLMLIATLTIPSVIYLAFTLPKLPKSAKNNGAGAIVRYGLELTLLNLPITLSSRLDYFLVSAYFGLNQLAVLSVALLIPEQVKVWAGELLTITFQSQARGEDSPARRKKLLKIVGGMTLIFAAVILLYIVLAPLIFTWLFPNYMDAIFLTQAAAAILITVPSSLLVQYLEAQAMIHALRWTRWIAAVVYCVTLIVLVPKFGLIGAIIARGLLRISYTLCALWFLMSGRKGKPRTNDLPSMTPDHDVHAPAHP
jgi:O-antigen/teichoic acid export membrane protein